MTILLREQDLQGVVGPPMALDAVRAAMHLEAAGHTTVPARITTGPPESWLRLMPALVNADGGDREGSFMGFKAMNVNRKTGARYVVLLYDVESGQLLGIIDASRLTKLRTAAVTTLACEATLGGSLSELGVYGSGFEASGHVEAFKSRYPSLARLKVYSPRQERREAFAQKMTSRWGLEVECCDDPARAADAPVVVLATRSRDVVARSEWFAPGTLVLSIASTRLDFRELDEATFGRSAVCVCDDPDQVAVESGDVQAAFEAGTLDRERMVRLADLVAGNQSVTWPPADLVVFKSVGTALQDLAVSAAAFRNCREAGLGAELGTFPVEH